MRAGILPIICLVYVTSACLTGSSIWLRRHNIQYDSYYIIPYNNIAVFELYTITT